MLGWLGTWRNRWRIHQAVRRGLRLGHNVRIIGRCDFGSEPYLVRISDDVTVSFDTAFITHDGGTWIFRDEAQYRGVTSYGPIRVDEGCFIGARCIILPGVRIGARSLIGAGAVVTRDIPPDSVAAGVPARVLMTRQQYIDKCVASQQRISPQDKRKALTTLFGEFLDST